MLNFNHQIIRSKKGQISDTITWAVATLIIIFLLVTSIYFSSLLGKGKDVNKDNIKIHSGDIELTDIKTDLAYRFNIDYKDVIDVWIMEGRE